MKTYKQEYLDQIDQMLVELREMKASYDKIIEANNQILKSYFPPRERVIGERDIDRK